MAVTTGGGGDWNSLVPNAPWPGGIIPAFDEDVRIGNGHTLRVPVGYTAQCGDVTTPTTAAIATTATNGTGILIVNGTLQVAADMDQGNANWQIVGAGATIESNNSSTALVWYARGGANCRLTMTGTGLGANRAVLRNGFGSAGFRFKAEGNRVEHNWTNALIYGLGAASVNAVEGAGQFSGQWYATDVVVDTCGRISTWSGIALNASVPFEWRRVLFQNSTTSATYGVDISINSSSVPRVYEDVVFDKYATLPATAVTSFVRCIWLQAAIFWGDGATYTDCVMRDNIASRIRLGGDVTRCQFVRTNNLGNWHCIGWTAGRSPVVDGATFDGVTDAAGDLIAAGNLSGAVIRGVVSTYNSGGTGGSIGKLLSMMDHVPHAVASLKHCTWWTGASNLEAALVNVGETDAGVADVVDEIAHNICATTETNGGLIVARLAAGASANVRNACTPGNITDNWVQQPYAGGAGVGNGHRTTTGGDGVMYSPVPADQLSGDIDFVDPSRNLATWYRDVVGGTPGTRGADMDLALLAMASQIGDSPVAGATIAAAYDWVRPGYAPTNIALKTNVSGDNGGWIGAEPGIEPPEGEIAIAVDPEHRSIVRGATGLFTVTLTRTDYTDPVTILATGLPTGVTASYPDGDEFTGGDTELTVLLSVAADAPLVVADVWSIIASGDDVDDAIEILTVTVLDVPPSPTLMAQRPTVSFPRATSPSVRFTP